MAGSTLIKRNIASGLTNTGGDGTTPLFVDFMDTTTAASAEQSYTVPGLTTSDLKFVSRTGVPGNLDWDNGSYVWNFRNGAATSLTASLITIKIADSLLTVKHYAHTKTLILQPTFSP